MGRYRRIVGTDFEPGKEYLMATGSFWKDVRSEWQDIIDKHKSFALHKKVDGQSMFMPLFTYANDVKKQGSYDSKKGKKFIKTTLKKYLKN